MNEMGDLTPTDVPDEAIMEGDDRPSRYVEGNEVIYRPSAITMCTSVYVGLAMGETPQPPPANIMARYQEGRVAEPFILDALGMNDGGIDGDARPKKDKAGNQYSVTDIQTRVDDSQIGVKLHIMTNWYDQEVYARGSIDGVGRVSRVGVAGQSFSDRFAVLEAKAFGPDYMRKFRSGGLAAFEGYVWQTSIYLLGARQLLGVDIGLLFAVLDKTTGELVVEWLDEPMISLKEVKKRIIAIEAAISEACDDEVGTGEIPDCDKSSYPCPMFHLHGVTIKTMKARKDELASDITIGKDSPYYDDIQAFMNEWIEAKHEETMLARPADAAKQRRVQLQNELTRLLGLANVKGTAEGVTVRCDDMVASWRIEPRAEGIVKAHNRTTVNVVREQGGSK